MARNKNPEQTIDRIIEISAKLFFEKGYENTSVQNIIDELGDLSKGAIYHHFKSKEDIFDAIAERMHDINIPFYNQIMNKNDLNGAQKLKSLVSLSISSESIKQFVEISPNLLDNPKLLALQMKQIKDYVAPMFILPIIEEGVKDNSIISSNPRELAEIITLMINVWINPLVFSSDSSRIAGKCKIVNEFLAQYNIVLFDDETINALSNL